MKQPQELRCSPNEGQTAVKNVVYKTVELHRENCIPFLILHSIAGQGETGLNQGLNQGSKRQERKQGYSREVLLSESSGVQIQGLHQRSRDTECLPFFLFNDYEKESAGEEFRATSIEKSRKKERRRKKKEEERKEVWITML